MLTRPFVAQAQTLRTGGTCLTAATAAILLAAASVPWIFATGTDDVFYLPKLIALWCLLGVILWLVVFGRIREEPGRLRLIGVVDAPVALFVGLNLCAFAFSADRHQSLFGEQLQHQGLLTTLLYVAFFYAARFLVTDLRRVTGLFAAVAVGAFGVSVYAIAQRAGMDPVWKGYLPSGRVFSTIGQPNALAAYLVLALPVTATFLFSGTRPTRVVAGGASAAMAVALVLTYSRGGYLGLLLAAVLLLGYVLRERAGLSSKALIAYAGGALIALSATVALVAPARSVVTSAWNRAWSVSALSGDESISNHLDQWRVATRIVETNPVLGTGPETFPEQFPRYSRMVLPARDVRFFDQFRVESPHDEVLAVAAGSGVPAALSYLAVLGGVAVVLVRAIRSEATPAVRLALIAVLAAGIGHFVTDSFMSAEVTGSWLFWCLIGAGLAVAIDPQELSGSSDLDDGVR